MYGQTLAVCPSAFKSRASTQGKSREIGEAMSHIVPSRIRGWLDDQLDDQGDAYVAWLDPQAQCADDGTCHPYGSACDNCGTVCTHTQPCNCP